MKNASFQIGQEVTFSNAWDVNVITEIKGDFAKTLELNTGSTYKKRLASLKVYVAPKAYWGEQELTNPIYRHGDTVYTILSIDGNGGKKVSADLKSIHINLCNCRLIFVIPLFYFLTFCIYNN